MSEKEQVSAVKINEIRHNIYKQCALAGAALLLVLLLGVAFTSAWYTNVVYTSGLVFHVEEYGFLGEVGNLPTESIAVYPGESGMITLSIQNDSALTLRANVSISKVETLLEVETIVDPQDDEVFYNMGEELQKRIYFYVDSNEFVNGESVGRTYINTINAYEYLITPWGDLSLGEDMQDDNALYWYWTEDVLGYYVIATNPYAQTEYEETDEDGDGVLNAISGAQSIQQYLQPIEYDYDSATFTEDGALETVDGVMTADEFMEELKTKDGYVQSDWGDWMQNSYAVEDTTTIDENGDSVTSVSYGVYYPIDVDATGYGVWAYLCDEDEIKAANVFDTMLITGSLTDEENAMPCTATLYISGNTELLTETSVRTEAELQAAIDANEPLIVLEKDIELTQPLTMPTDVTVAVEDLLSESGEITLLDDSAVVIDLNGCSLSYTGDEAYLVSVGEHQELTFYNGTLIGPVDGVVVAVNGGTLSLQQVSVSGASTAISVSDVYGAFTESDPLVFEEDLTTARASIVIEDSTIQATNYCLYLVGSEYSVQKDASVYVADSTLSVDNSESGAVFYPVYSYGVSVNIESGVFSESVVSYLLSGYAETISIDTEGVYYYEVAWQNTLDESE